MTKVSRAVYLALFLHFLRKLLRKVRGLRPASRVTGGEQCIVLLLPSVKRAYVLGGKAGGLDSALAGLQSAFRRHLYVYQVEDLKGLMEEGYTVESVYYVHPAAYGQECAAIRKAVFRYDMCVSSLGIANYVNGNPR